MLRTSVFASAALSLALAPIAAQAASQDLSAPSAVSRTGSIAGEAEELRGKTLWIVGAIALGLIIWGIIELSDDDEPESP
jgi:hypothetical protein